MMLAAVLVSSPSLLASDTPRMCMTPGGPHACECIHEVESGTRVAEITERTGERHVLFHYPNGTASKLAACPHERPSFHGQSSVFSDPPNICGLGWAHATPMEAFYVTNASIQSYTATYAVPGNPALATDQFLYYWIGMQDLNATTGKAGPVIQPVLAFHGSKNNWYFQSWNCCPAGHKTSAPIVPVKPGETLHGGMRQTDDGHFEIFANNSKGSSSVLLSDDTLSGIVSEWNRAEIVLETYNIDSCSMYAKGEPMQFSDMTLFDMQGNSLTPAWIRKDYINGTYLTPNATLEFQGCCNGTFELDWPSATMRQNQAMRTEDVVL